MYHFFKYKNIQIRYTSTGKGRAVVLVHGFLENLDMWSDIVPVLAQKNRVITIDLLGHGASENLGYIHTMEDQAQLIKALLNHLRLRKYVVIGHSMGGYISLAFAELFPETLKGLGLMNTSAFADTNEKRIHRNRAIKTIKHNHKTFVRIAIPNLFTEESKPLFKTEIAQLTKEALELSPQSIIASLEGMKARKDRTHLLKEHPFQKLFIIGKKDPLFSYKSLIKQTENTNIKVVEFSGGHMSHFENKEELITVLKDFVKSCN